MEMQKTVPQKAVTVAACSCKFHRLAKFIDDDFVLLSPFQTVVEEAVYGDGNGSIRGLSGMCVGSEGGQIDVACVCQFLWLSVSFFFSFWKFIKQDLSQRTFLWMSSEWNSFFIQIINRLMSAKNTSINQIMIWWNALKFAKSFDSWQSAAKAGYKREPSLMWGLLEEIDLKISNKV